MAQDLVIWLFFRGSDQLFIISSSMYELCIWNFSPTVLGFDGIPSFELTLSDYNTLSRSWSGSSTSDTDVKNKIPFIYVSLSCLAVLISSVSPHHEEMTKGSVIDARVVVYLPQTSLGAFQWGETTIFFPVLVPTSFNKLSQYVSALCFILFLGRNHYWRVIPFSTSAPNSWPTCSHRYSSWSVSHVFPHFISSCFPFCGISLGTFLSKLILFFILLLWHLPKDVARSRS